MQGDGDQAKMGTERGGQARANAKDQVGRQAEQSPSKHRVQQHPPPHPSKLAAEQPHTQAPRHGQQAGFAKPTDLSVLKMCCNHLIYGWARMPLGRAAAKEKKAGHARPLAPARQLRWRRSRGIAPPPPSGRGRVRRLRAGRQGAAGSQAQRGRRCHRCRFRQPQQTTHISSSTEEGGKDHEPRTSEKLLPRKECRRGREGR
ncbi:hypothetical protein VOLCADRAFT_93873 [Volvox carteri f. nagariensis]|uniref:Uncharacterized protein n=1 Tax=Volvox carteri f. nagariensis TaxID=3068 RepID=D8U3A6_VOLCA|nr:uncharacterized protein VOLCADRAFT_93873 [Volvox carteri f. nagariensis]EFJ45792.1 hypothetical protein VOLCADRAFT_93873 [Volvox carteri f. nagariensis]|eukprot:XP_002953193.1 hypothetical protein VOLCADRAFT_93873 [Volvox carteri f. nagariensis]